MQAHHPPQALQAPYRQLSARLVHLLVMCTMQVLEAHQGVWTAGQERELTVIW